MFGQSVFKPFGNSELTKNDNVKIGRTRSVGRSLFAHLFVKIISKFRSFSKFVDNVFQMQWL